MLALKACCNLGLHSHGREIIASRALEARTESSTVQNALIHFYGDSLDIASAQRIFHSMGAALRHRVSAVTVTAMMDALCKNAQPSKCIALFAETHRQRQTEPDAICYAVLFNACAQSSAFEFALKTHQRLKRENKRILQKLAVQTALIAMYGTFGQIERCRQIFESVRRTQRNKFEREIALWNAMITAHGRHGDLERVKALHSDVMSLHEKGSLRADRNTYICGSI